MSLVYLLSSTTSLGWSVPAMGWSPRVEKGGVEYLAIFDQSRGYCPPEFFAISFMVAFVPGMENDSIYLYLSPCIRGRELMWGPCRNRGDDGLVKPPGLWGKMVGSQAVRLQKGLTLLR